MVVILDGIGTQCALCAFYKYKTIVKKIKMFPVISSTKKKKTNILTQIIEAYCIMLKLSFLVEWEVDS